jgi:RimJ/RimL family protein N-acetyltransferase
MSGDVVQGEAARLPERVTLQGRVVNVVPLNVEAHASSLYAGVAGPQGDALWTYMFDGPFDSFKAFRESLVMKAVSADPFFFAIVEKATGEAVGMAAYLRIEPGHRVIEVGNIVYTPRLQRHVGGTEAMYLMARYVFEELGYRRFEWKCNALNAPSRAAALRYGFSFEGIFCQHMIVKGRNRDTAWFAMMDHEWPERKAAFEAWLAPANFNEAGEQKTRLGRV